MTPADNESTPTRVLAALGSERVAPQPQERVRTPAVGARHVPATRALIITGIPGAGKTTVARSLASRYSLAAHVEADRLQGMIVAGGLWPHEQPHAEAMRQLRLRARNAAMLATNFARAGIVPLLDDVIVGADRLDIYLRGIRVRPLGLVVLAPSLEVALERDERRGYKRVGTKWAHLDGRQRAELGGLGLWLDTDRLTVEETVDAIADGIPPEGNV